MDDSHRPAGKRMSKARPAMQDAAIMPPPIPKPTRSPKPTRDDAETLALRVLAWLAADPERIERFLSLTGVAPGELAGRAQDPVLLAAIIDFLMGHEPDLVACAEALEVAPESFALARSLLPA